MAELTFLSDHPAPLEKGKDPFGCLDTAATLYEVIAQWHLQRPQPPLIIGLLGGFGQGKSTILETLRKPLRQQKWPGISQIELSHPIEILSVESWHYQPDEISSHFNQVMTRETWMKNAGIMRKVGFATFLDFVSALKSSTGSGLKQSAMERVAADVPLYQAAGDVTGDIIRRGWDTLNTDACELARSLLKLPKNRKILFWVDDLDRSSVQVQLAFLKQIHAYRERLGVAVVIAIDPSDILKGSERSNNEDLLRKVFTATLIIPAKRSERFVEYAEELCRQQFPSLDYGTVQLIANLISYLTAGNPRFVKRYLNSLALTVHRIKLDRKIYLTDEKFACLARWTLAQTRWPLLFGYHGEEELLFSLLRRLMIGEPTETSLDAFIKTMDKGNDLIIQCKEAIHFLKQTSGLSGGSEIEVLGWLTDKEFKAGDLNWLLFWDSVECRSPNDAIDYLEKTGLPVDFLKHFGARISRWVNRRCFFEAVSILDIFWRIVYEQAGHLPMLANPSKEQIEEFFHFLIRTYAHEEVAATWHSYTTYPDLNSLIRVQSRLPENWTRLYVETISTLDGDFYDVMFFFQSLIKNQWAIIGKETRRKAINLMANWLVGYWKRDHEILEIEWRRFLFFEAEGKLLLLGVLRRLQHHLGNMKNDAKTGIADQLDDFVCNSKLYVWLLRVLSEYFESIRPGLFFFTSWFLRLQQILLRKALSRIQQQQLLEVLQDLIDIQLCPFLRLLPHPDSEIKQFNDAFIDRVPWRSLLTQLTFEDPIDKSGDIEDEICRCGLLVLEVLGFLRIRSGSETAQKLGQNLAKSLTTFKNQKAAHTLAALAAFISVAGGEPKSRERTEIQMTAHLGKVSLNAFYKGLLTCFSQESQAQQIPNYIVIIWYQLVRVLLHRKSTRPLLTEASKALCIKDFLEIYLKNLSHLKGLEKHWSALMSSDEKWRAAFISAINSLPHLVIPAANEFGKLLAHTTSEVFEMIAPLLQRTFAELNGERAVGAFRCGILNDDIEKWRSMKLHEEYEYSVLRDVERYLRSSSDPQSAEALVQLFLSAGEENTRSALRDLLPMFRAYVGSISSAQSGQKDYEIFFKMTQKIIQRIRLETENEYIRKITFDLADQL